MTQQFDNDVYIRQQILADIICGGTTWNTFRSQYVYGQAEFDRIMRNAGLTCSFALLKAVADGNGHVFPGYIQANPAKLIPECLSGLATTLIREYAKQFAPQFIDPAASWPQQLTF